MQVKYTRIFTTSKIQVKYLHHCSLSNPPSMSHHPMGSVRPSSVGPPSTASTQRSSPSPSSSPVPRITFQPTASSPVGLDSRLSHLTFTANKMVRVLQGKEGTKVFYQGRLPRDQQVKFNCDFLF